MFVKDGTTESGGQVTESVSTGASEEQDLEVEKHSSKANSKNKEVRPADAAPAIIDKKPDFTADFDSLPTSDMVKLKIKKNFEGHGVFEGVVEVSTHLAKPYTTHAQLIIIYQYFSLFEAPARIPCSVSCTLTATRKT